MWRAMPSKGQRRTRDGQHHAHLRCDTSELCISGRCSDRTWQGLEVWRSAIENPYKRRSVGRSLSESWQTGGANHVTDFLLPRPQSLKTDIWCMAISDEQEGIPKAWHHSSMTRHYGQF